eukprot:124327_1
MTICESGDRLLIHDGDYCLFVDDGIYTDKSVQFIGIGDNVRIDWGCFGITGNCYVYFKNIKIAFEKNLEFYLDQPTIVLKSNANLKIKDRKLFGNHNIAICGEGNG